MRNPIKRLNLLSFLIAILFTISSCTAGKHLRTESIAESEQIKGHFTVILYSVPQYDYLKTVAFLDVEGDGYELALYEPAFNYKVLKGVQGKEAIEEALHLVSNHQNFLNSRIKRILNEGGSTIGYEIRPLYQPSVYGVTNVLYVDYWLMDSGKVKVTIDLRPSVKRQFDRDKR